MRPGREEGRHFYAETEPSAMSQTQASGRSEIDLRIKEAETCYGMGMLEEALSLYELVIASGKQIPAQTHQVLEE